ncbi:TECR reductase, partial [Grantiella picta]|nr:TECR reductase [Grantiella picta]
VSLSPEGRSLKDEDVLQSLPVGTTATLYFRDLGAQISWVTVFLTEYAGPLLIYLLFYFRVPFLYGPRYDFTASRHRVVTLSSPCPLSCPASTTCTPGCPQVSPAATAVSPMCPQCPQNCTYYWGFAAWMAYYINHPLYTPPGECHLCHLCVTCVSPVCHLCVTCVSPVCSKTRKIPYPTRNPFTWLFLLVSCPNYTYEPPKSMSPAAPLALFSLVGFVQMAIWAQGKHRSYLREFRDYPPLRSPIIPFLL